MKSRKNKLLFTVSATLMSPMAQAHDTSQPMSQFDHIWAHVAEITGVNTSLLLAATIVIGLLASALFSRLQRKTTKAHA